MQVTCHSREKGRADLIVSWHHCQSLAALAMPGSNARLLEKCPAYCAPCHVTILGPKKGKKFMFLLRDETSISASQQQAL